MDRDSESGCAPPEDANVSQLERRAILVRGIVQGVGFRPFVFNLASRLGLAGFVRNDTGTVAIEVEGKRAALERFLQDLTDQAPPLAKIDHISWESLRPTGISTFCIDSSKSTLSSDVFISPDTAPCEECLAEMLDPHNRRFRYPFLNCTNCGPRLTIIRGAPYDRPLTTMAGFAMCGLCRAEYEDPQNRRFHAQPTCCAACGPRLQILDAKGQALPVDDPLGCFVSAILDGRVGALKGLGGYHLVCDAANPAAVMALRQRKHREEKPFAVMVRDLAAACKICLLRPGESEILTSPRRPIVLLQKRLPCPVADDVAPRNDSLGVMLPYTPLHHLLMNSIASGVLVMTSGNRADEPIAYQDNEAVQRLSGIADLFLIHDRPINVRCDDSVTRIVDGIEMPVRRSRGYAPQPIALPFDCPFPILALGGQLKGTFAFGRKRQAFLSHHLGDLDNYEAYKAFARDVALYEQLLGTRPQLLVHDLHPDYATTRYAQNRAEQMRTELLAVQHHHAHMASCMAENLLNENVIGVSFDGTGFGTDGAIWGGEFLVGNYRNFQRAGHLRYIGMPGGDQAIRQPWRMAIAHLLDAHLECPQLAARISPSQIRTTTLMLERRLNCPVTSSVGRLFDAVASLAGVRDAVAYEGQAAVELEQLALHAPPDGAYSFEVEPSAQAIPMVVDTRPLIREVVSDVRNRVDVAVMARRFQSTLVEIVTTVCLRLRDRTRINAITLSGGVFLNKLLLSEVCIRLRGEDFRVYRHRQVPPNDGGLSLGQLAMAAACSASQVVTPPRLH
jgi:hydrogenase maturation protein HypF